MVDNPEINPGIQISPKASGEKAVNPLDMPQQSGQAVKNGSENLIKSIIDTESGEQEASLFDDAPELDMDLLEEAEPQQNFLLILLKILFAVIVTGSIFSLIFFASQLTTKLDFITYRLGIPNVSRELFSSVTELKKIQTDLNFYHYIKAKAYLDEFSYLSDSFRQNYQVVNSQTASESEKDTAKKALEKNRSQMKEILQKTNEEINKPFLVTLVYPDLSIPDDLKLIFETELRSYLEKKAANVKKDQNDGPGAEALNYLHARELVGKESLKTLLASADIEAMDDTQIYEFIQKVNAEIVNNMSLVQEIKKNRIKWSDIMNEIELRTIAVDKHYSEDFFEEFGGIRYTSYDFDSNGPRITISGETKRYDTTNFTTIVNLIEELNNSPFFQNGEMRSFSKSGSQEDGYVSTLQLSLDLETTEITNKEKLQNLKEAPEILNNITNDEN